MEEVFGIPRPQLENEIGRFQGFRAEDGDLAAWGSRLEPMGTFRPRDEVEDDPTWQQLIPYVAVTCREQVLVLERLATQGESRLHHRSSIGVGGHVNPEPEGPDPLLVRGLRRELEEELVIDLSAQKSPVELMGFINDDSNEVGAVHFGVAARLEVPEPVEVRETDRMRGRWVPVDGLSAEEESMETWSRLLVPAIISAIERDRSLSID